MIGTPVILWLKLTVSHSGFGISAFSSFGISGVRFVRYPCCVKPGMSAASSWTMSAAVPPTKLVSSLSCTELTSTGTICTWIDACDLFQAATISFIAATVVGCQT